MNADQVIDLVQVLIWPAVVVGLVLFFRRQVNELLLRLKAASFGALQAVFETGVKNAEKDVHAVEAKRPEAQYEQEAKHEPGTAPADERGTERALDEVFDQLRELVELAPESAVDTAWKVLFSTLTVIEAPMEGKSVTEPSLIKRMGQAGLGDEEVRALRSLRRARIEALEAPQVVTPQMALKYIEAAHSMAHTLTEFSSRAGLTSFQ
ncbi:hypothetical protein [Streptomyces sp. MZ04]|uniref:hypothetical protein n=1 Tax=Streptomyces sp. MZ04 TaxID=2559236 RepID=UPI00107EB75D|nr:hypothetical protein [Streptomyces sp. MZ04]TGB03319.1 hypothetical protein E2651_25450 [Streptomyces sp. MZ04]